MLDPPREEEGKPELFELHVGVRFPLFARFGQDSVLFLQHSERSLLRLSSNATGTPHLKDHAQSQVSSDGMHWRGLRNSGRGGLCGLNPIQGRYPFGLELAEL